MSIFYFAEIGVCRKPIVPKLIITFSDDEDDDSGDDEVRSVKKLKTEKEDLRKFNEEECVRIKEVIDQAKSTYVNTDDCKYMCSDCNTNDDETLMTMYNCKMSGINIPAHMRLLVPYYINNVAFSSLKWLPFNANNNVSSGIKRKQTKLLKRTNPALWICDEVLDPDVKQNWLAFINNIELPKSNMFEREDECPYFVLVEYSYLNQANQTKGLCGLCMILCEVDCEDRVKIKDLANIKLSCNSLNRVYGNIYTFLDKYGDVPMFTYTPQGCLARSVYNTYLFPWSKLFTSKHELIFNLISTIKMDSSCTDEVRSLCIDTQTHYKSCAICNCLNFYFRLARNEFEMRLISDTINNTLVLPEISNSASHPKFIECEKTTFVTYSSKNVPITQRCSCKK